MKIPTTSFRQVNWAELPATLHPGSSAEAGWRQCDVGDLRTRIVEYAPGYVADHWCARGHVLFVIEGELRTELQNGTVYEMSAGSGYIVSDSGDEPHRSMTATGAKVFIVD